VGAVNANYYIPVFTRFEAADRPGLGWNWAAALCTLNWMAYRQLWSAALAYAGAVVGFALLVFGIGRLVFQLSEPVQLALLAVFVVAAFAVPGVAGNAIFYTHCRKKMAMALAANHTLPEACAMLESRASSRQRMLWLGLANAAVIGAAVGGYFAFPQGGLLPHPTPAPAEARALVVGKAVDLTATSPSTAASNPTLPASAATGDQIVVLAAPAASAPAPAASVAAPAPIATVTKPPAPLPKVPDSPLSVAVAPKAAAVAEAVAVAKPKKSAKPKVEKSDPKSAKKPPAAPVTNDARYFVNVGLFADDNNALNATVKLTDAGLPAFKQELETKKGKRTRVRVGPFDSAAEADKAVEKIRALGLDAIVFKP
jgi:cell division septation protein DedD